MTIKSPQFPIQNTCFIDTQTIKVVCCNKNPHLMILFAFTQVIIFCYVILSMSEGNTIDKKNKELEPDNKERNLQEYSSNDKGVDTGNKNEPNRTNRKELDSHSHDEGCSCAH